jgi:hypothetical protein
MSTLVLGVSGPPENTTALVRHNGQTLRVPVSSDLRPLVERSINATLPQTVAEQLLSAGDLGPRPMTYDNNPGSAYNPAAGTFPGTPAAIAAAARTPSEALMAGEDAGPMDFAGMSRQQLAGQVYDAFLGAGFSPSQARALTAEINRENSMRPNLWFGSHSDPHNRAQNIGILSWQGSRARELQAFLGEQGLLDEQGRITPSPEALRAQAAFLRREMETRPEYARTRELFLANPDVDYDTAHSVLGDNFIRWRRTDPQYRDSGYGRIDEGYSLLEGLPTRASVSTSGSLSAGPFPPRFEDVQNDPQASPTQPRFDAPREFGALSVGADPAAAAPQTFSERLMAGLEDLPEALRYLELADNSNRMRAPAGPGIHRPRRGDVGSQALKRLGLGSLA